MPLTTSGSIAIRSPRVRDRRVETEPDVLDLALLRRQAGQLLSQHHRMLEVASGALHGLVDERSIEAQPERRLVPERAHGRRIVVGEARSVVEIDPH